MRKGNSNTNEQKIMYPEHKYGNENLKRTHDDKKIINRQSP